MIRICTECKKEFEGSVKARLCPECKEKHHKLLLHFKTQDAMSNRLSNANGAGGFLPEKRTKRSVKHAEKKEDMAAHRWWHTAKGSRLK